MILNYNEAILENLIKMFANMKFRNIIVQNLHCNQLKQFDISWTRIFNNNTCFYFVRRKSKHVLICDHDICETCIHIFEHAETAVKYFYRIDACLLCDSDILKMTLKFFIAEIRLLNIDGDDVRKIVSFEFLILLQNELKSACKIQDLFDLTFETNSDKSIRLKNTRCWWLLDDFIACDLFLRRWNVHQCKQNFDALVRRTFNAEERNTFVFLRHLRRVLKCWFSNDYYDVTSLENTLKFMYDSIVKMFDFHEFNNSKIAITITTIFDAMLFVISSYDNKKKKRSDSDK